MITATYEGETIYREVAACRERPTFQARTCPRCGTYFSWVGYAEDREPCPACAGKGFHPKHRPMPRPRRRSRVRRIDRLVRIDHFGKRMRRLRRKERAA